MPPQDDPATESGQGAGRVSSLGEPLLAVGAIVAGAALTLLAKRLIDARRTGDSLTEALPVGGDDSKDDLATVLRRAALDVAVAASGQAAERLGSRDGADETEAEEAEGAASSSR